MADAMIAAGKHNPDVVCLNGAAGESRSFGSRSEWMQHITRGVAPCSSRAPIAMTLICPYCASCSSSKFSVPTRRGCSSLPTSCSNRTSSHLLRHPGILSSPHQGDCVRCDHRVLSLDSVYEYE